MKFFNQLKKRFSKRPSIQISKRQIFVLVTVLLTMLLITTQFTVSEVQYRWVIVLGLLSYIGTAIAIREDLEGIEFLTLMTLPVLFTLAVSLFYFLLPQRLLTRLPIALLYAVGMYAVLLTENIYNVSAERSIALLRAAQSVGFLISLVTAFFLIETVLSFHLNAFLAGALVSVPMFFLILQSLWSMKLGNAVTKDVLIGSLIITLVIVETVVVLSFWPVKTTIAALFLTTEYYTLVGMTQQYLVERLFDKTKKEFSMVLFLVLLLMIFATKWGFGNFV